MTYLRDIDPLIAEILDGKHDTLLPHIERAAKLRMTQTVRASGLRAGSKIVVNENAAERAPDLVGRKGVVERVNPKTVTVTLEQAHDHDYKTGWRLPHDWLTLEGT